MLSLSLAGHTGATYGQGSYRMAPLSATKSGGSNPECNEQNLGSEPSVVGVGRRSFSQQLFHAKQSRTLSAVTTGQRDSIAEEQDEDLLLTNQASDQQIIRVRRDFVVEPVK